MRYLLLLTVLLLCPASLQALAGAAPYGREIVFAGATWAGEVAPWATNAAESAGEEDSGMAPAALRTAVEQLQARASEQELVGGPYAPGLPETLDDLARALELLGDHAGAMRTRERALHLLRVNDGLNSPRQGPLLRVMLESLWLREDYAALDARYRYFYRLYGAGRPPYDAIRWPAALEYLRWQREALRRDIDGDPDSRLLEAHAEGEKILDALLAETAKPDWQRLREATGAHMKTLYLIEDKYELRDDVPQAFDIPRRQDELLDFDVQRERLENIKRRSRTASKRLLEQTLAAIPASEHRARAEVELALADWLQWRGSTREARIRYEALWTSMQDTELRDLASSWFATPRPLPDNGVFHQPGTEVEAIFAVEVAVSAAGRADVAMGSVPSGLGRDATRVRRQLMATRFRPAVEGGKVVDRSLGRKTVLLLSR